MSIFERVGAWVFNLGVRVGYALTGKQPTAEDKADNEQYSKWGGQGFVNLLVLIVAVAIVVAFINWRS